MNRSKVDTYFLPKAVGLCSFIACMTPRFITTFKIYIGMSISFFTVFTLAAWLLFSGKLIISKSLDCILFCFMLISTTIGVLYTKNIGDWLYYFVWIVTAFFFLQLLYSSASPACFDYIWKGMVAALQVHLVLGLYEITAHTHLFHTGNYGVYYYGTTPIVIFHNPNDYATFVITAMPFNLYAVANKTKPRKKAFFLLSTVAAVYLISITQSRAAFFSLIGGMLCFLVLHYKKSNLSRLMLCFGVALLLIIGLMSDSIRMMLAEKILANGINFERRGDLNRWNLVLNGISFLKRTYGLGVGAGNLKYWLINRADYYIGALEYLHNWYLELGVTYGIFIFVLYMVCHVKTLLKLYRRAISVKKVFDFDSTMLISFFMFSIVCIASSSNAYSEWVWMYYVFAFSYALHFDYIGLSASESLYNK